MEIYGFIPFPETLIDQFNEEHNTDYKVNMIKDQMTVMGSQTIEENVFSCVLGIKLYIISTIPTGDTEEEETGDTYEQAIYTTSAVTIRTNSNLDVLSISDFTLVDYNTGKSFTCSFDNLSTTDTNRITITNYMGEDLGVNDIEDLINDILNDFKNMKMPDLEGDIYNLTNGDFVTLTETNDLGQEVSARRWQGTFPLDQMIQVMSKNLDNLVNEGKLKGDNYVVYYADLFKTALTLAVELEKSRWQLITDGMLKFLSLKVQVLTSLAEFRVKMATLSYTKSQTRTMTAQYKGFAANNTQKILQTQVEGATSAFAAGMTETAPSIYNNRELMMNYSLSATSMYEI